MLGLSHPSIGLIVSHSHSFFIACFLSASSYSFFHHPHNHTPLASFCPFFFYSRSSVDQGHVSSGQVHLGDLESVTLVYVCERMCL